MNSFEKVLVTAILSVFAILLAVATIAYRSMTVSVATAEWVERTYETIRELETTLATLRDTESGVRAFVITGDRSHLQSHQTAAAVVGQHIARIKRLTSSNLAQPARLATIEALISARLAYLGDVVRTRAEEDFRAARRLIAAHEGKQQSRDLRRLAARVIADESRRLRRRVAHAEQSRGRAVTATLVALPLIFVQLLLVVYLIRRHLAKRAGTESALRRLAMQDELTGLFNRREMNYRLREEVARWRRYRHPLSLILLDIDRFKAINDTYGHQVGDEVLQWVADHLRSTARGTDVTARFGGEEFTVILPETTPEEAYGIAERIRAEMAAEAFVSSRSTDRPLQIAVTISAGVAGLEGNDEEKAPESFLVTAADQALYEAKRTGRNRTVSQKHAPGPQLRLSLSN
jgi:diguanylate cyclase (GGDEF)-like protein